MARIRLSPIALAIASICFSAQAQQAAEPQLPEVKVRADANRSPVGPDTGYGAKRSLSGTKTDTPLNEIPQTIEIITRDLMDMQQVQSVPQALRYTGLISEPRGGMTKLEYLYSRGFQVDQYLDGLRLLGGAWGISQIEPYQLERVEVLKGPASILYGQASPGGVVNLVSKRPSAENYRDLQFQIGSFNRLQAAFDATGALNQDGSLSYRFTTLGRSAESQADFAKEARVVIAPSLMWKGRDTSFTLQFNYQQDPEGGFYNWVPAYGTVLPGPAGQVPRSFNAGEPNFDQFKRTQYSLGYLFEHRLNDTWTLRQNLRWNKIDTMFHNVFANVIQANRVTYSRYTWNDAEDLRAWTIDNQVQAKFNTGALAHTVLAGLDYQEKKYDQQLGSNFGGAPAGAPPINIFNPVYGLNIPLPPFGGDTYQKIAQTGLYLQDQIKLDRWVLLAGLRQDSAKQHTANQWTGITTASQADDATTGRLGAVYLFDNGVSPYVSYSESFQPSIGTDFFRNSFVPTTGQQTEVGVKFQSKDGRASMTLSVFDLAQQNVLTSDPVPGHGGFQVQTGEITSRGVELSGSLMQLGGWNIVGSFANMDLLVTRSNTTNLNKRPVGMPGNKASLWADYSFGAVAPGLVMGAGVRYIGETFGDSVNSFKVPDYTLLDGAIHYNLEHVDAGLRGYKVSLNVSNLTDKTFVSYCGNVNACAYGVGRTALLTLRRQW